MPRVHKQIARKDIYQVGGKVEDPKTKSGFRKDRSIPADKNDTVIVHAGQTYYSWTFRYGGKRISTTYPKPSQLTQSAFLQTIYQIQEDECFAIDVDDFNSWVQEKREEIEELQGTTQDSLDNMPDSLQYSPTGEMLQERIDALDSTLSELDEWDCKQLDEDEDEWIENWLLDNKDEDMDDDDNESEAHEAWRCHVEETVQEWIEELEITYDGP